MELRQLRYYLGVLEHGSLGRAALELGVGASALSQQLSKLEGELCTRLLTRTSTGVAPTAAGLAFQHHARLTLRQAEHAVLAAQSGRMSGYASVGLAPTTASILGLPLIARMRERYPDVRLHLVEMLSGYLVNQLNARHLDLAVLFQADVGPRLSLRPLLQERFLRWCQRRWCGRSGAIALAWHSSRTCRWCCPAPSTVCARRCVQPSSGWGMSLISSWRSTACRC